jgi:transcriptional/translational regulatory protein YebC/TACO1
LRLAVDKALAANMTKDTMERAIRRGSGAQDGENFDEIRYTKAGGNLGTSGSVAFQFAQTGILSYPAGSDEDAIMEAALEAGAQDVVTNDDGSVDVLTEPDDFVNVSEAMASSGFETDEAEVTMRAENTTPLDKTDAEKMIRLLDRLEDLDDVQNVYSNADISAEILAEL